MFALPRRPRAGACAAAAAALIAAAVPAVLLVSSAPAAHALGNGLALTPPMGWNDWNAFGCGVSEQLVEQTAQYMVTSGMKAAGYQYVNIDDCWSEMSRDANGNLVPDPAKFPDGIKGTADYVHSLGMKLGLYAEAGTATCAGFPGSLGHEQQDANTFASWGVDYLKYDNCNSGSEPAQQRYTAMRDALAATGRPILFALCEWGVDSVWTWGAQTGDIWRTTSDISPNFGSMLNIFHANVALAQFAGPGGYNDPDMLEVGNGMSATEDQSEFALWSEMAAPLLAGTDLRTASAATMSVYLNKDVIAVDQDSLGRQGAEVSSAGGLDVLAKPLANGDVSVVLFNENSGAATVSTTASAVGLPSASSYTFNDLWAHTSTTSSGGAISASVPAHGVVMYRITANGAHSPSPSATPSHSASGSPSASASPSASSRPTPSASASSSPSPSPSGSGSGFCHVVYSTQSQWAGGFTANVTIDDTGGAPINGWTLTFSFPGDQKVTSAWNATATQSGAAVTAVNMSYNGAISPGGSAGFGFQGTWTASNAAPTAFAVNGKACT
ncbi:MAG TPA: cellulose binding domain-containing protein [Actinocrinis sp.]|nr:cellulose binding domain-containing protein [Actinocrinis sp.]